MQVKKTDVYNRILTVATKLFITRGYDDTSLQTIADKSYISKSNVYRYFSSKEEIYETIVTVPKKKLIELTNILTDEEFIKKDLGAKIEITSNSLAEITAEHRIELLVLLKAGKGKDKTDLPQYFTKVFVERCVIEDAGFKALIAKIQIVALIDIIMRYEDPAEIKKHVKMFYEYHYKGLGGLI